MNDNNFPFTLDEFKSIYSKVPRLTVEIIVKDEDSSIFLTKRAIPPYEGQWHIPGGTVFYGEAMTDAVKRIAKRELGIDVKNSENNGYIEYPIHHKNSFDAPVGLVFIVTDYDGVLSPNEEAIESGWFKTFPEPFHPDQAEYVSRYLATK